MKDTLQMKYRKKYWVVVIFFLVDSNASVSIKNAGGYAMISVTDSVAGVSTVVRGWSNYPYIYLYDIHATNINVTLSPKNNPFNH